MTHMCSVLYGQTIESTHIELGNFLISTLQFFLILILFIYFFSSLFKCNTMRSSMVTRTFLMTPRKLQKKKLITPTPNPSPFVSFVSMQVKQCQSPSQVHHQTAGAPDSQIAY